MSMLHDLIAADVAAAGNQGRSNRFVVTLTPTAEDFSGTMDKTVAEINEAWQAGKEIWFKLVTLDGTMYARCNALWDNGDTYPSFNGFIINDTNKKLITAITGATNDGTTDSYGTKIYSLDEYVPI